MELLELLERLSLIDGTSGDENLVREEICRTLAGIPDCRFRIDAMGNVIAEKKGRLTPNKKVMLAAHMDEVGFIVTDINAEGFLSFAPVGGIMPSVVLGKTVRSHNGTVGVIGHKPIHLLEKEEKDVQPKIDSLYIDIGAVSREDAEKVVSLGDCCYFVSNFFAFGANQLRGKAIDDRAGCAIMLDMLSAPQEYDCTFAFTVQEEVGCRGAGPAAYTVKPDVAIVLEATTACDIPDVEGAKKVCSLGEGTVISFMDGGAIYDKALYSLGFSVAKENGLKAQTKTKIAGGNDSRSIQRSAGGVRTIALSVPCRYLHSPSCVINKDDFVEMRTLAQRLLEAICKED